MGMFDSVMFKCPKCGHEIEAQSKSGSCDLKVYRSDKIPDAVIDGLWIYGPCDGCGTKFKVLKPARPVIFYSLELEEIVENADEES